MIRKRKGFVFLEIVIALVILSVIVEIVGYTGNLLKIRADTSKNLEVHNSSLSYLTKAKNKCKIDGVGNWTENIKVLNKIDTTVTSKCELVTPELMEITVVLKNLETSYEISRKSYVSI